jgi:hypothetical protein
MAGWRAPNFVAAHPGEVDAALTTGMGRAAIFEARKAARVKSFSVEYLGLVPVGQNVTCVSSVVAQRGPDEAVVQAEIRDAQGKILARSTGVFDLFDLAIGGDVLRSQAAVHCDPAFLQGMQELVS